MCIRDSFSSSKLYDHESVTYQAVFGSLYTMRLPVSGNRIILATRNGRLPTSSILAERAKALGPQLSRFGVALESFPEYITGRVDWDTNAEVLTDQYAPANLLNQP